VTSVPGVLRIAEAKLAALLDEEGQVIEPPHT
jgi:hypothetical protein